MKKSSGELADLKQLLKRLDAKPKDAGLSITEWRRRREAAEASIKELELAKARGEVVNIAEVEAEWSKIGVQTRDAVMGLPARVINCLPAEWRLQLKTVIDEEARQLLAALSDEIRSGGKGKKPCRNRKAK